MNVENGNEAAFPSHGPDHRYADWATKSEVGMTKREYFAGLAMQGLLSSLEQGKLWSAVDIAADAVQLTDALLSALSEPGSRS